MHTNENVGTVAQTDKMPEEITELAEMLHEIALAIDEADHANGVCAPSCDHCARWDAAKACSEDAATNCPTCGHWRTLHFNGDGRDYCKRHYPNAAANL